jgi:hypothetical protein
MACAFNIYPHIDAGDKKLLAQESYKFNSCCFGQGCGINTSCIVLGPHYF